MRPFRHNSTSQSRDGIGNSLFSVDPYRYNNAAADAFANELVGGSIACATAVPNALLSESPSKSDKASPRGSGSDARDRETETKTGEDF